MLSLHPFQTSLETIQAHHWRYYTDVYMGCQFDCQYCLYRGPKSYGNKVRPLSDIQDQILFELAQYPKGILDIGGVSDAYQPMEGENKITQKLLRRLLDANQPTFLLTKGTLILRDVAILREMAKLGIIEVCFSLISLNSEFITVIEPGTESAEERLRTAAILAENDIPVSFHLAPVIPEQLSEQEIYKIVNRMKNAGAQHVFSSILGARSPYWSQLKTSLKKLSKDAFSDWDLFASVYPEKIDISGIVQGCNDSYLFQIMETIRNSCIEVCVGFICENIPALTTTEPTEGIYRWKLPTVFGMANYISKQSNPVSYKKFYEEYWSLFRPHEELQNLVYNLWVGEMLFSNTKIMAVHDTTEIQYQAGYDINITTGKTMTVRKSNET